MGLTLTCYMPDMSIGFDAHFEMYKNIEGKILKLILLPKSDVFKACNQQVIDEQVEHDLYFF